MRAAASISRRALLGAGLAALAGPGAAADAPRRIATVDWAVLETLLALGAPPVAATELIQFRSVAVEPEVPPGVVDLGLRGAVNFELLLLTRPDLILSSSFYATSEAVLRRIAPVESFTLYAPGVRPYEAALAMTRRIGAILGRPADAEALIAAHRAMVAGERLRLARMGGRPVLAINLGDARHFRVFGADSMFGEVLGELGLVNAWTAPTSYSAMAPVGLERLALFPQAWIAIVAPVPPDAEAALAGGALWRALPAVQAGRVVHLASIDPFGALPAADRFARLLSDALVAANGERQE